MTKTTISLKGQIVNLKAGTQVSIDVQGESLMMKRLVRNYPDWHTMRGITKGGKSLTKALMEDRAAEVVRDNANINQGR